MLNYGAFLVNAPFPETQEQWRGMDLIRSGSSLERAARYREQAAKLRAIAATEDVERIRMLLLAAAAQYQHLAESVLQAT